MYIQIIYIFPINRININHDLNKNTIKNSRRDNEKIFQYSTFTL